MKQHITNAVWGVISATFRSIYGLVNVLLAARLLGPEAYGQIVALMAAFVLYGSLSTSIFTILVVKLMSSSDHEEHSPILAAGGVWIVCSLTGLALIALTVGFVANSMVEPVAWVPSTGTFYTILALCVLTAFQIVGAFQLAIIESQSRFDIATKSQLFGPLLVLMALMFFSIFSVGLSKLTYVALLGAGAAVDLVVAWVIRRKMLLNVRITVSDRQAWCGLWQLLKTGSLLQATSLMNIFLEPLNKGLLNAFLGGAAVTVYDISMKLIWGIQNLFSSAMRVFLHIASTDPLQLQKSYLRAVRLMSAPAILLHVIGCLFLVWLGRFWVPMDTHEAVLFFTLAMLSNVGMIGLGPLYNGIIGTGNMGFIFRIQARLAIINATLSILLIPIFGVLGAAFGLFLATLYNGSAIFLMGKRLVGNDRLGVALLCSLQPRVAYAVLLYFGALYCGMSSIVNVLPLGFAILGFVLFMLVREPAVALLASTIRQRYFLRITHANE